MEPRLRLLLDTHALIWWLAGDEALSRQIVYLLRMGLIERANQRRKVDQVGVDDLDLIQNR